MNLDPDLIKILVTSFCFTAIANGLFLAFIFLRKKPFRSYADILIVLLLVAISLSIGESILFYIFQYLPGLVEAFGLSGKLAIGPLLLLLVRSKIQNSEFKTYDLIHFLPSMLTAASARGWSAEFLTSANQTTTFLIAIYIAYSWILFLVRNDLTRSKDNILIKYLLVGLSLIWVTFLLQVFSETMEIYLSGMILSSFILYWINYQLTIFTIRNGKGNSTKVVSNEKSKQVQLLIERFFTQEKVYRDPKLTLSKFSSLIDQPDYVVSVVINKFYKKTFPEFLNHFRVNEIKEELLRQSNSNITIEGIAYNAGFNTSSAFYTAFKKKPVLLPGSSRPTSLKNNSLLRYTRT